ncbi:MAG: T9SS type A sorting domain-containing protein [Bacteroidota bacterium]
MKRLFTLLFLIISAFFIAQTGAAQEYLDVPALTEGVPTDLAKVIKGDTLADGSRTADRVYRLEREAIYLMGATVIADYPVKIVANGDDSQRPPMIAAGLDAQSANVFPFFQLVGDDLEYSFTDVFFQGIDLNRQYSVWVNACVFQADSITATFEGCVFNAFTGGATAFANCNNPSIYFRDNIWRHGVSDFHPFIGQQVTLPALPIEKLVVTNNTYINNNSFWLFQENGLAKTAIIEHNTVYGGLIDVMRLRYLANANVKSNIFYAEHAFGDTDSSRVNGWYEPDHSPMSVISLYEIPDEILTPAGMTEAGRVVNVTNNAWFTPQPIIDYWEANAEIYNDFSFMNTRTDSMFSDNSSYPYLVDEGNVNKNPSFTNTAMDTWMIQSIADFCTTFRATDGCNGHCWSGNGGSFRNYDEEQGVDIFNGIQWPLPETLAYSDAELLAGGHDDLPVGDLNWHAGMREQYVEPTEVEKVDESDPYASQQTPALTDKFFAKWKVTPTHAPMDGATGFSKTAAEGSFGKMGILVRFNSSGNIDARNGTAYEALNALAYEAGTEYTVEVTGNVKAQNYSVSVTPAGGTKTVIGTDYGYRTDNPQDTFNYFSVIINELAAWGGVEGSRLNPSFMDNPFTNDSYELNVTNNDAVEAKTGAFSASFDIVPTAAGINAAFGFAKGEIAVQGYSGMSAYFRCKGDGYFDARDGGAFNAENQLAYTPGEKYSVVMDVDVAANTYDMTVTPDGGSSVVIADDYGFRAAADTINNTAELLGIGGMWGNNPGDLIISNLNITVTGIDDLNTPEFSIYPNPAKNKLNISFKENVRQIEVYNLVGKQVMIQQMNDQPRTTLDVSSLPQGVYVVQVSSRNGKGSKLFVKQ